MFILPWFAPQKWSQIVVNRTRSLWGHGNFFCFTRRNLLIKFERAEEKAVRHVLAVQTELYGLPLLERDLLRTEGETLRSDFDDGNTISVSTLGSRQGQQP